MTRTSIRRRRVDDDRGHAGLVVVAVAVSIGLGAVLGLAELGRATTAAARAQSAADAAALAGLDGGRPASVELANRNGAKLVAWRIGPGPHEVTVVVRIDGVEAIARGSDAP